MEEAIAKTEDILPRLQQFDIFKGIDPEALEWLIDRAEYRCYESGSLLFRPGEPVDHMQVVLEGRYVIEQEQQGERRELGVWETGYVTGVLPFSRMVEARAFGRALERCCLLELHRRYFTEMVNVSYELTQALVAVMSTRIRDFASIRFQNEKLMALGKLSAGLAHELNNPASAMVRDAQVLYERHHQTPDKFKAVITMRITPEQTDRVNAILDDKLAHFHELDLSAMERMDRQDELQDWLEEHTVDDAEDLAETFVDFGMTAEDLDEVEAIIEGAHLPAILRWLESTLSMEKLVRDIQESADRINKLVQSVKQYSYMDRGISMEPVDVHEGLRSTLTMLKHHLKQKNIQVDKDFDTEIPPIPAYAGELNQVWTNLLANAIDAMPEEDGRLRVRTYRERQYVCVRITDNGTGIPEEHLTRIFDPFYTTKGIGEGTGMGLDIVQRIVERHRARIDVQSRPGETSFTVCFPVTS